MIFTEKTATRFVVTNLKDKSLDQYFSQDEFKEFMELVRNGKEIAAAKMYEVVTNAHLEDCHFAVLLAKQLLA